jgi:N-acyl-D-aspartate/D-glutamate deacylase
MLDLNITGGTIVDGSGAPRYRGDVGVKDGRIVAIGILAEPARETVDAAGRVVAPGFIDAHTHYDAQVFWDPTLSPSCYHGVTTVIGGFCGFSIAPMSPEAADYLMRMLARVEGMPLETLRTAVPWNWRSFGEFLNSVEGKTGLNAGFFAGHSAIRRVVMGERAVGEKSTPEELAKMKALLEESLAEGALGFSTTISMTHNDGEGNPVPSRWADYSEILELGRVVSRYEGTGLELLPGNFNPETIELMADLSVAGNRPVNWNALLLIGRQDTQRALSYLAVSDYARSRGGEVIALAPAAPPVVIINFKSGANIDANPGIWPALFKLSVAKRIAALRDPEVRNQMAADAAKVPDDSLMKFFARFENFRIESVRAEKNKKYIGRQIGDVSREQDRRPIDVLLDIALDDDLDAGFAANFGGDDFEGYELRSQLWRDDRTLIGASDAGAHLDQIDTFAYSTTVLQKGVREHGVITLEEAIYQMSDRPARYFGLIDRGLLRPGYHADIIVFDDQTITRGPTYYRYDVPGNQFRVYADAFGIDHVFVNGIEIVRHGHHTGNLPGTVLRSGRDTRTVFPGALREDRVVELTGDLNS